MSAVALLAELEAVGIHLAREHDRLRVRGEPGVRLGPYLERITPHKPALLQALLQREIVAAVSAEPAEFNRDAYDRLWLRWHAQDTREVRA
jgi:hypothetical protein